MGQAGAAREGVDHSRGRVHCRPREAARWVVQGSRGLPSGRLQPRPCSRHARRTARALVLQYTPGTAPGKWRPHPNPDACQPADRRSGARCRKLAGDASAVGQVTPFTMTSAVAVPALRTTRPDKRRLCPRLRRGETAGREEQLGANDGAVRDRAVLVRGFRTGLEPYCPRRWRRKAELDQWETARLLALRQCGDRRRLYRRVRYPLRLRLLAPVTAIRAADTDGNDATMADPAWEIVSEYAGDARLPVYA